MGVLVWLLETETGDLDELQLTNLNHLFWKEVTHRGLDFLSKKDELYEVDFLRHLYKKVAQSNVLIVNHAFLAQESLRKQPLLPESPWLIIDEAHHLPDIASRMASERVNSVILKNKSRILLKKSNFLLLYSKFFNSFLKSSGL